MAYYRCTNPAQYQLFSQTQHILSRLKYNNLSISKYLKLSKFQVPIILILLLAAFLRFYNLPNTFVFAGDEEHQAILAQSLVKDFHIIWVGVNAAHLGFYLGPYWAYFTSLWLWLSKGDPLITGFVASSVGVFTTLLIILVGQILFNKRVGLISGLLYATLPLMVFLIRNTGTLL